MSKTLQDFNFKNKKVLLRCDFNVSLSKKGEILDDFRIKQTIPTIEHLIKQGAKVILMSHLGNPGGKTVENLRLIPVQEKLKEYLNISIIKTDDCIGKNVEDTVNQMKEGEVLLLENIRFHKEEEEGDLNFAEKLAKLADIYINDAFGVCHRKHASVALLPKFLPYGKGLLLEKEIKTLSNVLEKPWRPLVVIIGGVKISTKIKMIEQFLKTADHLLIGGKIANTVLSGKGILIGRPLPDDETLEKINRIDLTNPKMHLPVDGIISLKNKEEGFIRQGAVGTAKKEEGVYDIGPETIKIFKEIIKTAKMIVWNGPLGLFEDKKFEKGTREIAEEIVRNYNAFKIVGGGETISIITKLGLLDKFDHVSTGGGAMLEFLSGEKLPGIAALEEGEPRSVKLSGKR